MPETLFTRTAWIVTYIFMTIVTGWFFVGFTHTNNGLNAALIVLMLVGGIWFSLSNRMDNEANPSVQDVRWIPDDDVEDDVGD